MYLEIDINGTIFACGGTLITDTWVVTAAHCLNEIDQVTVYSGDIDRTNSGNRSTNTVTNLFVHPDYEQANNTGDIALLKLSSPVALPALPIKLMSKALQGDADIEFDNEIWDNLVVSGWGRTSADREQSTNILQKRLLMALVITVAHYLGAGHNLTLISFVPMHLNEVLVTVIREVH